MRHRLGADMSLMRCHRSHLLKVVDVHELRHCIDGEMRLMLLEVGVGVLASFSTVPFTALVSKGTTTTCGLHLVTMAG